jgi:Fe-S oxidoreductase
MDVPFEPVHYMEHVFNRLKELDGEITPLKCSAVYQRPCSSRLSPEMHHFVKDICDLIGVKLLQRKYQDENSLCCGEPLRVADFYETANDVQQKNLSDMVAAQPDYCIFNCFACQEALGEKVSKRGITPIHIINLVRMALNEPV